MKFFVQFRKLGLRNKWNRWRFFKIYFLTIFAIKAGFDECLRLGT